MGFSGVGFIVYRRVELEMWWEIGRGQLGNFCVVEIGKNESLSDFEVFV